MHAFSFLLFLSCFLPSFSFPASASIASKLLLLSSLSLLTPYNSAPGPYISKMPLSKMSLGCSAFGGVFVPMTDDECLAILRKAFAEGISLLDTAPWYQASERVLGRCLQRLAQEVPRSSYQLNTKVGRYPTGKMFDFSADRVARSVQQSLEHLQTDYIDIIQVHDCEFGDEEVIVNETLPLLDQLRQQGTVRKIGITGYELGTLRSIIERSKVKIDSVLSYCRYTLNDRALLEDENGETFVDFLESRGVSLINASAISMGLLCNREPPAWHPASDDLKSRAKAASDFAEERGCNLARLALGFVLQEPRIETTLVSVTSMELMEANLDVMLRGLDDKEASVLNEVLQTFFPVSENWEGVEKARMAAKEAKKSAEKLQEDTISHVETGAATVVEAKGDAAEAKKSEPVHVVKQVLAN